jgi:tetratricopeptide (TPR) repeat protein
MSEAVTLDGAEVAITGRLLSMSRAEAVQRLREAGASVAREPGFATTMLVVGDASGQLAEGRANRSLEQYRALKAKGLAIRLVGEQDFLRLLGAQEELEDLSRQYTAAQVSRIAEVPLPVVRGWIRTGLLQPARQANRLAWFEFKDIVLARTLARLTSAGVPASQIQKNLSAMAQWLPDGERIIARLETWAAGLRVRLPDGGLAEPSGQRLMDFHVEGRAAAPGRAPTTAPGGIFPAAPGGIFPRSVSPFSAESPLNPPGTSMRSAADWCAIAEEAEEQGDLEVAAVGYGRALEVSPQAETYFNLGNVLYEMGREGDAAERYLQAIHLVNDFAEAWNNLGNAMVALGKLDDGVRAYEMALSLEPGYPDAHCNLATVLERLGRTGSALVHRAACLRASPSESHLTLLRQPARDED